MVRLTSDGGSMIGIDHRDNIGITDRSNCREQKDRRFKRSKKEPCACQEKVTNRAIPEVEMLVCPFQDFAVEGHQEPPDRFLLFNRDLMPKSIDSYIISTVSTYIFYPEVFLPMPSLNNQRPFIPHLVFIAMAGESIAHEFLDGHTF
jgi:hypothetical protein